MATCESCGMPLDDPQTVSKFDKRYCIYCQDQNTGDLANYAQVREGSIGAAIRFFGKTQAEAEAMVDGMLPQLPRWRQG
ncbi:MAG TPA: zinc ribbon domain-containing protein [Dehalococcoidia bacterium]|nr:zinc ribbon domain-containing protein [Dehalococcoidia bacterium]